jgi:regulator of sigma E protease
MEILTKAVSLIFSLSILVVLHELGHFIPAKLFKTRVEKFYLFFDPWFSLVKKKIGGTTYGIGWLPLGGYVKIAGMVDESMDKEQMSKPAEPWEFRSKPTWQRLIIMVGGVVVNILLAIVIYSMILFTWGKDVLPNSSVVDGIKVDQTTHKHGFKDGDKLKEVDGETVFLFSEFKTRILLDDAKTVLIGRNGKDTLINISQDLIGDVLNNKSRMWSPLVGFTINSFTDNSLNKSGELKVGDQVIAVNDKEVKFFQLFAAEAQKHKCEEINMTVLRNGTELVVKASVDHLGYIGAHNVEFDQLLKLEKKKYSFIECIPGGVNEMAVTLTNYVKQFKLVFTPAGASGLGGFGALGGLFPSSFGAENYWESFWSITALLSVILAFMNILPIPALDGGHVMFLLYEMIARKKPGEKFMEYAQMSGMILLFGLMIFANGNDIFKMFSDTDDAPKDCVEYVSSKSNS